MDGKSTPPTSRTNIFRILTKNDRFTPPKHFQEVLSSWDYDELLGVLRAIQTKSYRLPDSYTADEDGWRFCNAYKQFLAKPLELYADALRHKEVAEWLMVVAHQATFGATNATAAHPSSSPTLDENGSQSRPIGIAQLRASVSTVLKPGETVSTSEFAARMAAAMDADVQYSNAYNFLRASPDFTIQRSQTGKRAAIRFVYAPIAEGEQTSHRAKPTHDKPQS